MRPGVVHLVPLGEDGTPLSRGHSASTLCKCGPVASFAVLETGDVAYRHRVPPQPTRRERIQPTSVSWGDHGSRR